MARPRLSTATGDDGTTGLIGTKRVAKSSAVISLIGDTDELNAVIGLALCEADVPGVLRKQCMQLQQDLFVLGADLAAESSSASPRITADQVQRLEQWGVTLESKLPELTHFILPSGCRAACLFHQARTVCRRIERAAVAVAHIRPLNRQACMYLNRLSDYLFLAARTANSSAGAPEEEWSAG